MSLIISAVSCCLGSCFNLFSSEITTLKCETPACENGAFVDREIRFYDSKTNQETAFLSNFYDESQVFYDKAWYPCAEAAFQAAKTLDKTKRESFKNLLRTGDGYDYLPGLETKMDEDRVGHKAWYLGRQISPIRSDWEEVKDQVMHEIVYNKFNNNSFLKTSLLATGDVILLENAPNDYWGIGKGDKGQNKLGKILMQVRNELSTSRSLKSRRLSSLDSSSLDSTGLRKRSF